jgi:hypothetical protein
MVQVRAGNGHLTLKPGEIYELNEGEISIDSAIAHGYLAPADDSRKVVLAEAAEKNLKAFEGRAAESYGRIFLCNRIGVMEARRDPNPDHIVISGVHGMGGPAASHIPDDDLSDLDEVEEPWKTRTKGKGMKILELEEKLPFWVEGYTIIQDEKETPKRRVIYRVKPYAAGRFISGEHVRRLNEYGHAPIFVMGEVMNLMTGRMFDSLEEMVEWRGPRPDASLLKGDEEWKSWY